MNNRNLPFIFVSVVLCCFAQCIHAKEKTHPINWYGVASSDFIVVGKITGVNKDALSKSDGKFVVKINRVLKGKILSRKIKVEYVVFTDYDKITRQSISKLIGEKAIIFLNLSELGERHKFYTNSQTISVFKYAVPVRDAVLRELTVQSYEVTRMLKVVKTLRGKNIRVNDALSLISGTDQRDVNRGVKILVRSGCKAVPAIIASMQDSRPFKAQFLYLKNGKQSFEAYRTYGPKKLYDALSAVLNEITGTSFEEVHNGAPDKVRKADYRDWLIYLAHFLSSPGKRDPYLVLCSGHPT